MAGVCESTDPPVCLCSCAMPSPLPLAHARTVHPHAHPHPHASVITPPRTHPHTRVSARARAHTHTHTHTHELCAKLLAEWGQSARHNAAHTQSHTHTHTRIHTQELRAKLLAEAEQSARQNAAVAMRWADLFSIEVPQELYQEIEKQRQACEKIIASKDKLISGVCVVLCCAGGYRLQQEGQEQLGSLLAVATHSLPLWLHLFDSHLPLGPCMHIHSQTDTHTHTHTHMRAQTSRQN